MQTTHKHLFIIIKKINYKLHLQAAFCKCTLSTWQTLPRSFHTIKAFCYWCLSSLQKKKEKKKIFSLQEINLWTPDKKDVANGLLGHLAERRQNLILFSTYKKICSFVWYKMIRENFSSKWKQSHLWRKITSQWHLRLLQACTGRQIPVSILRISPAYLLVCQKLLAWFQALCCSGLYSYLTARRLLVWTFFYLELCIPPTI